MFELMSPSRADGVRLWQIDRGDPIFDKNGDASGRVRVIARPGSVRHCEFCSKIIFIRQKIMFFVLQGREIWYFLSVKSWHQNCVKIYIWPLLDVENPNLASNRRAMGGFSSQILKYQRYRGVWAPVRGHCAISVRPSSWSNATGRYFSLALINVADSIFVDIWSICQSRIHMAFISRWFLIILDNFDGNALPVVFVFR